MPRLQFTIRDNSKLKRHDQKGNGSSNFSVLGVVYSTPTSLSLMMMALMRIEDPFFSALRQLKKHVGVIDEFIERVDVKPDSEQLFP